MEEYKMMPDGEEENTETTENIGGELPKTDDEG